MNGSDMAILEPLDVLRRAFGNLIGAGGLGVVVGGAGAGKTALVVRIGLCALLEDRDVLHVALGQTIEEVKGRYDGAFDRVSACLPLDAREERRAAMARHRVIKTYGDGKLSVDRVERTVETFSSYMGFEPAAILIDGFDWRAPLADRLAQIAGLRGLSARLGAALWMTSAVRPSGGEEPDALVTLEERGDRVEARVEAHGREIEAIVLDRERLLPLAGEPRARGGLAPGDFTLLSGGAPGAEAEFGLWAERYGLAEVTFSFAGRQVARSRGLVELSSEDLRQGDVSIAYLIAHMRRAYPETPEFRKIMQSIWHQVATAGEVFAVGVVQPDKTFKGGTGWAPELARHWRKPVHVFDQERRVWLAWRDGDWVEADPPRITRTRFAGTGTRSLDEHGKRAIRDLFERTFGPLPVPSRG